MTEGRRRKRCLFFRSLYKSTWFERAKLDIETNLKFVALWLQDWWAKKFAQTELFLQDKIIGVVFAVRWWYFAFSSKTNRSVVKTALSRLTRKNLGQVIDGQWVSGGICREM